MKATYVRVELFDPVTEETFPVHGGLTVSVARLERETRRVDVDRYPFAWDEELRCFTADAPEYKTTRRHFFCVTFHKRNFSKTAGELLSYEESLEVDEKLWAPTRIPHWDSGWDDNYRSNEYFGVKGLQKPSRPDAPIVLRVPIRRFYVVGHRGAPHFYPENTLPSFQESLNVGANGLEFDLCLNADGTIAVFHDSQPTKQPPRMDRTRFEKLPYELISPEFNLTGRKATFYGVRAGQIVKEGERELVDRHDLDLIHLTFPQTRDAYRYPPVNGEEHRIIDFEAFLAFCAENTDRLRFLFFDVKPPAKLSDPKPALDYGRRLATTMKKYPNLPERMVIGYADVKVLRVLKQAFAEVGEERPWFAFDAAGSASALLEGLARGWHWLPDVFRRGLAKILPGVPNPLLTARAMKNRVVSVGSLARPASLDEIREAVRDRDYRPRSAVDLVVHWTLNDREQFAHSVEAGVNAILTDQPDDLVEFLKEMGVRVT